MPRTVDAQAPADAPSWSVRASAAAYLLPDDDNFVQPTVAADLDALHLEARYTYEDRRSASAFVGWNLALGTTVTLDLTPMFGIVSGNTEGIVPALEAGLAWRRLELYSEGEYVIVDRGRDRFSTTGLRPASGSRTGSGPGSSLSGPGSTARLEISSAACWSASRCGGSRGPSTCSTPTRTIVFSSSRSA
jgi:hypothetical protein